MSATNWDRCPQCMRQKEYDAEHLTHMDFMHKWDSDEIKTTLREDYGIYVTRDGEFCVDYSCFCDVCGFSHTFGHNEKVNIKEPTDSDDD